MNNKQLTKNFCLTELVNSNTATRLGIDNTPTPDIVKNLTDSAVNLFQPVRDILGQVMIVNSGYRCPLLNKKVGGAQKNGKPTSAHCYGYAIDFTCPSVGTPLAVARIISKALKTKGIKWDQIIIEFGQWVHIAYKAPDGASQRQQLLVATREGGKVKYTQVNSF